MLNIFIFLISFKLVIKAVIVKNDNTKNHLHTNVQHTKIH